MDLIERNRWTAFDLQCLPAKWHNTPDKYRSRPAREDPRAARRIRVDLRPLRRLRHRRRARQAAGGGGHRAHRRPALLCLLFRQPGIREPGRRGRHRLLPHRLSGAPFRQADLGRAWASTATRNCCRSISATTRRSSILAQTRDEELAEKAMAAAKRLGLAYEYRFTGYGELERTEGPG